MCTQPKNILIQPIKLTTVQAIPKGDMFHCCHGSSWMGESSSGLGPAAGRIWINWKGNNPCGRWQYLDLSPSLTLILSHGERPASSTSWSPDLRNSSVTIPLGDILLRLVSSVTLACVISLRQHNDFPRFFSCQCSRKVT